MIINLFTYVPIVKGTPSTRPVRLRQVEVSLMRAQSLFNQFVQAHADVRQNRIDTVSRIIQFTRVLGVLIAVLLLTALPKHSRADGNLDVSYFVGDTHVSEGRGGTLWFTATNFNIDSHDIVIDNYNLNIGATTGDASDTINGYTVSYIGPGSAENKTLSYLSQAFFKVDYTTPADPGEVDQNFGVTPFTLTVNGHDASSPSTLFTGSATQDVTVTDTPEPGSLALFAGFGLTGALLGIRRVRHRQA